ncbi:MAG: alpha/beta hydrolase [Myxococcales bacterium]|nr:alpha/beta hydrolase [Myxococcales bacterium]
MATHVIYKLGPFTIPGLRGERYVRVYLPDERTSEPLPVLYLFDGQNVFHDAPSFSGGWYLHHAVHDLHAAGKRAPVIVGVDHGGEDRVHELSPFACDESRGEADHMVRWIARELAPRIRGEFPVRDDVASTAIGGSSMGGLAGLYAHFRRPDVFGAALAMSPSLWFAGYRIFDELQRWQRPWTSRIYLDAGAHEGNMLADASRLAEHLKQRGYTEDEDLLWYPDPYGAHSERDWRKRAPQALEQLFSGLGGAYSGAPVEDEPAAA